MRTLLTLLLALLAALLAGCATGPRSVEISRERLQAALESRFPYEARPAGFFTIVVGVPRLQLLPESNRLRLDFSAEASDRMSRSTARGNMALSFAVRYEPSDSSIRAANVRAEVLDVQGLPMDWRVPLQLAAGIVAERLIEGMVLHAFTPQEIGRARGWTPGSIRVTPTGVRIELLPPVAGRLAAPAPRAA